MDSAYDGIGPADEHIVRPKVLDDVVGGTIGVEHDEVRLRIDRGHHPRVGLVEELLPRVGVPSRAQRHVIGICIAASAAATATGPDILRQSASTKHGVV